MNKELKEREPLTLERVGERLEKISAHRSHLVSTRMHLNERLEASKKDVARKYIDGDRSGLEEAGVITSELQAIETALGILDEDQKAGEMDLKRANAADLRQRASQKQEELDRLNTETGVLLAKLSQLEDVSYTHSILSSQPMKGKYMGRPLGYEGLAELSPGVPRGSVFRGPEIATATGRDRKARK
jgi:chromosome segregation ATPase